MYNISIHWKCYQGTILWARCIGRSFSPEAILFFWFSSFCNSTWRILDLRHDFFDWFGWRYIRNWHWLFCYWICLLLIEYDIKNYRKLETNWFVCKIVNVFWIQFYTKLSLPLSSGLLVLVFGVHFNFHSRFCELLVVNVAISYQATSENRSFVRSHLFSCRWKFSQYPIVPSITIAHTNDSQKHLFPPCKGFDILKSQNLALCYIDRKIWTSITLF